MSTRKNKRSSRSPAGLVVHRGHCAKPPPVIVLEDARVELCGTCGGPSFLCRADHPDELPEQLSPNEQRWLAALRAVHLGLALSSHPAAGFGGALLTLARRLVTKTAVPDRLFDLAPDPRCPLSRIAATKHALAALLAKEDDWERPNAIAAEVLGRSATTLDVLHVLAGELVDARARWVREVVDVANAAALASPFLDHSTFPLVAVVCPDHGPVPEGRVRWEAYVRPAEVYDLAIRCPANCQRLIEHPLPFSASTPDMPWPALHPVARCQKGAWAPSGLGCVTHRLELGADAMCREGRLVYERAQVHIAQRMAERTETTPLEPWESRLTAALVMSLQPERARRRDERDDTREQASFAGEFEEAMRAMSDDIARLPADMGGLMSTLIASVFDLGAKPTMRGLLAVRYDLVARRGSEVAEYLDRAEPEATEIETDLAAQGWTVARRRCQGER